MIKSFVKVGLMLSLLLVVSCGGDKDEPEKPGIPEIPEKPDNPDPDPKDEKVVLKLAARTSDGVVVMSVPAGAYMSSYNGNSSQALQAKGNHIDNVKMDYNGRGWQTGTQLYWKDAKTKADVYAYAPYSSGMNDCRNYQYSLPLNQTVDEEMAKADFLWGKSMALQPTSNEVSVTMQHKFAKVIVKVVVGEGFTADELNAEKITVTLSDLKVDAIIDLGTGQLKLGNTTGSVTPKNNSDMTFTAIVIPQTVDMEKVVGVTVGEHMYKPQGNITFEEQKTHTISVTVSKDGTSGLNVGIDPWDTDGKDYGGVAE